MLCFRIPIGRQKEQKSGVQCSMEDFKSFWWISKHRRQPKERRIVERFLSSAPSTTTFTPETVHAVISVIGVTHENVYGMIQTEVRRKKLVLSTSVAAVHQKQLNSERKETRYFMDMVAPTEINLAGFN